LRIKIPTFMKRLGCGVALLAWFVLLTLPCFAIVLATQGEIILTHSDIPFDDFRVWLIQQPHTRGLAISNSNRVSAADGSGAVCTVLDAHFLLWEGEPSVSPHYCSCYTGHTGNWTSISEGDDACHLAGEQAK